MRKILCAGGFLLQLTIGWSQSSWPLQAGLLSRQPVSVLSQDGNPVSILSFPNAGFGMAGEKKFLLSEYGEYHFALVLPQHKNGFGLAAWYGGSGLLHRTRISLGYARQLDQKLGAALQFVYHSMILPAYYGKATAISARLGISYQLSQRIRTAFHISDPFGSVFRKNGELLYAPDYSAGLGYSVSEKFYTGLSFRKMQEKVPEMVVDMVYAPLNALRIIAGLETFSSKAWIGMSWTRKNLRFGLVAFLQDRLGPWPVSMIGVENNRNSMLQ